MTIEKQLELWLEGISVHNKSMNECCPDFSCCGGNIADRHVREQFVAAFHANNASLMAEMLGMFLQGMVTRDFPDVDINVVVSGGKTSRLVN